MQRLIAPLAGALLLILGASLAAQNVPDLLSQDRDYAVLPGRTFETLGWHLPDGGRTVKAIADAAPGGAFDPKQLAAVLVDAVRWVTAN